MFRGFEVGRLVCEPVAGCLFIALMVVSGCGSGESTDAADRVDPSGSATDGEASPNAAGSTPESVRDPWAPAAGESLLTLSLAAADYFCPSGFSYNASTRLCESDSEALGPFTPLMIANCEKFGGGSVCSGSDTWNLRFVRSLRGPGVCPVGSQRDQGTGLCADGDDVFGPFSRAHVANCREAGGGMACESMRWDKGFAERTLPEEERPERPTSRFTFPFSGPADASYTEAPRSFGSCRDGCSRRHAAADLYGQIGRPIYAVADGTVLDFYAFYLGTYALVVDQGDFVARYGEIKGNLPSGVYVGARVKRGQHVGTVGNLIGLSINMLHFERFSGRSSGPLSNDVPPFFRRSDLVNPTADLNAWPYPR
jgi:hypothetical protein